MGPTLGTNSAHLVDLVPLTPQWGARRSARVNRLDRFNGAIDGLKWGPLSVWPRVQASAKLIMKLDTNNGVGSHR